MSLHSYFLLYCGQLFALLRYMMPFFTLHYLCRQSPETLEPQDIDLDKELKSCFLLELYCFGNTSITHYK